MDNGYIAVIDSGIGGISVLIELLKTFPFERFIYFGDNQNAPYGNRAKHDLLSLCMHNINIIKEYPIKALVLACNTLSVNLISEISEYSGIQTFGIFPPVERCEIEGKKTLLLATRRTCSNYKDNEVVKTVGFYDLAKKIEDNVFNLSNNYISSCDYDSKLDLLNIEKGFFYNVIIGCTHYNFIKNQIVDHFQPQKLLDGTKNMIFKMKKFVKLNKSLEKNLQNQVLFIGKNALFNKKVFNFCGQSSLKNDNFIQKSQYFFLKRVDSGQKLW